jgi:hypothetical protein
MRNYSPTPWVIDNKCLTEIRDATGRSVATVAYDSYNTGTDGDLRLDAEAHANSQLLRAAPDLLAACETWLKWHAQELRYEFGLNRVCKCNLCVATMPIVQKAQGEDA